MADPRPNARDDPEAWTTRELVVFMHRDISSMKLDFDRVLRPFKVELRQVRQDNEALRGQRERLQNDLAEVMQLIAKKHPETFDAALALMLNPKRSGWKKFRSAWRQRVGLELPKEG